MTAPAATTAVTLRRPAEDEYAHELEALAAADTRPRPPNWRLSPWAVCTYLLGGTLDGGFVAPTAAEALAAEGIPARVVSMPCMEVFREQDAAPAADGTAATAPASDPAMGTAPATGTDAAAPAATDPAAAPAVTDATAPADAPAAPAAEGEMTDGAAMEGEAMEGEAMEGEAMEGEAMEGDAMTPPAEGDKAREAYKAFEKAFKGFDPRH